MDRLRAMEAYVTSAQYEIDRELNFLAKRMKAARVIDPARQPDQIGNLRLDRLFKLLGMAVMHHDIGEAAFGVKIGVPVIRLGQRAVRFDQHMDGDRSLDTGLARCLLHVLDHLAASLPNDR